MDYLSLYSDSDLLALWDCMDDRLHRQRFHADASPYSESEQRVAAMRYVVQQALHDVIERSQRGNMFTLTMSKDDAQELADVLNEKLYQDRQDYGDSGAYAWIERLLTQLESAEGEPST